MRHCQSPLWTNIFSVSSLDHIIPAVALKQENKSLTRSILVSRTCWSIQLCSTHTRQSHYTQNFWLKCLFHEDRANRCALTNEHPAFMQVLVNTRLSGIYLRAGEPTVSYVNSYQVRNTLLRINCLTCLVSAMAPSSFGCPLRTPKPGAQSPHHG